VIRVSNAYYVRLLTFALRASQLNSIYLNDFA